MSIEEVMEYVCLNDWVGQQSIWDFLIFRLAFSREGDIVLMLNDEKQNILSYRYDSILLREVKGIQEYVDGLLECAEFIGFAKSSYIKEKMQVILYQLINKKLF